MKCSSCKKEIKEDSQFCPYCGFDITKSKKKVILSVLLLFFLVVGIGVVWKISDSKKEASASWAAKETTQEYMKHTSEQFIRKTNLDASKIIFVKEKAHQVVVEKEAESTQELSPYQICASRDWSTQEVLPDGQVEDEVLRIRKIWNATDEKMKKNKYKVTTLSDTQIKVYSEGGYPVRIIVPQNEDAQDSAGRQYQYENGELIFAFVEDGKVERRLYYYADLIFRYRLTDKEGEVTNFDNDFSNADFLDLGDRYYVDGMEKYNQY